MTASLDFALLAPEINSARMYSGAGSAPMVAAASAWKTLAAELRSSALSYGRVLAALSDEEWHGPASAAMASAATPYVAWLGATSAQAEQAATQAESAAAAYDAAFAATVPPPTIAVNRAQLMQLVATNTLGQNTPAIAATEAQYGDMWAQDAAAMYGYAASSATATQLTTFTQPQQIASPSAIPAQAGAVAQAAATSAGTGQNTLSQLMSAIPNSLQSLASPAAGGSGLSGILSGFDIFSPGSGSSTTGLAGLLNSFSGLQGSSAFGQILNANIWNTIFSSGFYMPGNYLGTAADFAGLSGQGAEGAAGAAEGAAGAGEGAAGAAAGAAGEAGLGAAGGPISGALGQAGIVGPLSVPPSWTGATPQGGLSPAFGGTPMVAPPPAVAAGMPPVPIGNMTGLGMGRATPQYGFRPSFVARPPSAG
jgi:PPE-repeat protein